MGLPVRHTATFEITFNVLIQFLRENWGDQVVEEFIEEAEKVISLVTTFPQMYKPSLFDPSVRVAPINKLSSLFYEAAPTHITLLYIVDNRQEPFWL